MFTVQYFRICDRNSYIKHEIFSFNNSTKLLRYKRFKKMNIKLVTEMHGES